MRTGKAVLFIAIAIVLISILQSKIAHTEDNSPANYKVGSLSGSICYQKNGDIFIYDLQTGAVVQVSTDGNNSDPTWTMDGKSILYVHTTRGKVDSYSIRLTNLASKITETVVEETGVIGNLSMIQPQSVFYWTNMTGNGAKLLPITKVVFLENIASMKKGETQILLQGAAASYPISRGELVMYNPNVLYSGFKVVDDKSILYEIKRVNGTPGHPIWSPDAKFIAYQNAPNIMAMNVETWTKKDVTGVVSSGEYFDYESPYFDHPSWSSDGKYLICTYHTSGTVNKRLILIDRETGEKIFITEGDNGHWSSEGR